MFYCYVILFYYDFYHIYGHVTVVGTKAFFKLLEFHCIDPLNVANFFPLKATSCVIIDSTI